MKFRARTAVALLLIALLAIVVRLPVLRHPLGLEASNTPLARAVCAAANYEARGFLASGGLPVVAPLPVQIEEAIAPGDPPLLAWTIYSIHFVSKLDFAFCGRIAECLFIAAAAFSIFTILVRRAGTVPAFTAAVFVVCCPMALSAGASELLVGFSCAALLAAAVDTYILKRTPLAAAAVAAAGALGSVGDYRFCIDAAAAAAVGLIYLRKDALRPGALLALLSPLFCSISVLAIGERLAGTASYLYHSNYWFSGGVPLNVVSDLHFGEWLRAAAGHVVRECLPVPAVVGFFTVLWFLAARREAGAGLALLFISSVLCTSIGWGGAASVPAWQIRWAAPIAAGCAVAVGWVIPRWRFGAVLLATLFIILLFGSPGGGAPRCASELEALGRAARSRVAFGESFATAERFSEIVMAAARRPVITKIDERERGRALLDRASSALYPCRYFITIDPTLQKDEDTYLSRASLVDEFAGRELLTKEGPVVICDFTKRRGASRPASRPAWDAIYRYETRTLEFALPGRVVDSWNIEIAGRSLGREHAARLDAGVRSFKYDEGGKIPEKLYIQPVPFDAESRPAAEPLPEIFLRTRTLRKLRSKVYLLFPAFVAILEILIILGELGWSSPARAKNS